MIFLKTLILSISILLMFKNTDAHGPSRQKVSEKISINAEAKEVWNIVKDFKNFKWNPSIKNVKASDNKIGSERQLEFQKGYSVKQKLEKIDDKKQYISWRIIETSNEIMPVNSYAAKIFVKDKENGTTEVLYKAGFYRGFMGNDPPEELNDENSKKKVSDFIINSLKGLKVIAENK